MPGWMIALSVAGLLCLPLVLGVCQDNPSGPPHATPEARYGGSLAHYRQGETYLAQNNLPSATNEFREAIDGDLQPPWTEVWSHIQLGRIFDKTGQRARAVNEYKQAEKTGDNTFGALDEASAYLKQALQGNYVPPPPHVLLANAGDPIQKTEPEYTDEARLAELEGTVVLAAEIDESGLAQDLHVVESVGLGLDEKAIEAVKQWSFRPAVNPGPQAKTVTQIHVDFRLPSKESRWHLIGVRFQAPAGVSRPVFQKALYPIGAGIGPEAMEEGRVLVAIGRLATAQLTFDVDEHGVPVNFQTQTASEPVWGSEATSMVSQWRFTPGSANGIPVAVPCTVDLLWGERELSDSTLLQWRDAMNVH
jgi:TonB family protein